MWRPPLKTVCACLVPLAWACAGASFARAADTLSVGGPAAAKPMRWTADQLKQQFAAELKPVEFDRHGKHHTGTCVPMLAVLQAAGVPTAIVPSASVDPHHKHPPLRIAVIAEAPDGYAVIFSLAELLPEVGHQQVWLMLDEDGQPLAEANAPASLLVPGDAKPARQVHGVNQLRAVDLSPTTTQP